jgi:vitamin B12 transporter
VTTTRRFRAPTAALAIAALTAPPGLARDDLGVGAAVRETIVVTGSSRPVDLARLGRSATVIDGDDIEARGVRFLGDALREVPGLAVSRQGGFGGLTAVRVRGAEANHVLVLVDGIEIASADTGEVDLSALLALDVERVEVLRGPQSGLYGSNALAGVINIITRRGGAGAPAWAAVEAGSFETLEVRAGGGIGDDARHLSGAIAHRESEGFNISPSGDERDGDRNTSLHLRGGATLSPLFQLDGTARYVVRETDTDDFDFSGGPNQGLSIDAAGFSDTTDWSLGGLAELASFRGALVTTLTAARTETELQGGGSFGDFGTETSRTKFAAKSTLTLDAGGAAGSSHAVTLFADHERETFLNTVPFDPSQAPEQERSLVGVGVEYRVELGDRLSLSAVARQDNNDDFADAETFSVAGAFLARETGTRLHASVGSGVTNPTFFEQFGFEPGSFVGNPDLAPETALGWDAGVEQTLLGGAAILEVTYFDATLEDEIVNVFPSVENDAGESRRRGVETSLRARLGEAWDVSAVYTYTDAENPDGTPEVRRPEHSGSFDVSRAVASGRARISAGVVYNGEMVDDDFRGGFTAVKSPVESYTLARLAGSYRLNDRVELFARVENAFDQDYEEVIGYETPERGIYVGVRRSRPRR